MAEEQEVEQEEKVGLDNLDDDDLVAIIQAELENRSGLKDTTAYIAFQELASRSGWTVERQ